MLLKKMFGWCVLAAAFSAFAEVRLASPFADGMVLQRDREIAVWGTADALERVKVSFAGHEVSAVANARGEWKAHLPKLPASKEGRVLTARSEKSGTRQTIKDVLVGEVWFVCGQSNAEMPLAGNVPHFADRQGRLVAQMTRKPHVRYAYASNYKWSPTPKKEASYPVVWKKFLPVHLGNPPSFSAMAVYFALELESALGIPVGLVGSYWGGSNIDAWTPHVGYEGKPELKETADWKIIPAEDWSPTNACGVVNGAHQQPTVMWNEMIEPWCPMTMRGFLWYQGCHSSGEGMLYAAKMQALYDGWAKKFENPGLKLYFVQLAPYSRSWWDVQIAQAKFAAREKNAAMVTTADIGNFADIHPSEKGTVGKRLAALALRHDYGFDICADAPVLAAIRAQEDRLHLSFENADGWYVYDPEWKLCGGFEIAGSDGVWKPAYIVNADNGKKEAEAWRQRGRIKGRDIVLASDGVRNPVKVRYLYRKPWVGTLFASSGLPLGPFEADVSRRTEKLEQLPWIGDGRPEFTNEADFYGEDPAPEFRAACVLPPGEGDVVIDVACAGYCRVLLNGQPPKNAPAMMPHWSPYDKTIYAERLVFSASARRNPPAKNTISITLGNGFYNLPPLKFWGKICFRENLAHGRPCFKMTVSGVKDPLEWKWRNSRIIRNCVYLGEELDWSRPEDREWKRAAEVAGPKGRIVLRESPPMRMGYGVPGKAKWLKKGDVQVVDFGVNATGIPRFMFSKLTPGRRIEIVYGERLNPDGSVNVLTQTAGQIKYGNGGAGAPHLACQRDVLVMGTGDCKGSSLGAEVFSPKFVWHIFRYAEVRGYDVLLDGADSAQRHLLSPALRDRPFAAAFKSANKDFEKIHEICRRTFLANAIGGVQSDCPGRERLGYGGDIVATCQAYMLNWDMREFYLKTLQDFADEAAADGWITETAPYTGVSDRGFGGRSGPISWAVVVPVLMDALMRHYPDVKERALAFYPVCARYARLVDAKCPSGIIPQCIGDHEALERAPDEVTATAHWHLFAKLTAKFARMLGRTEDAEEFDALAAKIKTAFAAKHVKSGVVANGTQSAQAQALYLGLVPEEQIPAAEATLVAAIEAKGCAPSTGIFSTRYMLMYLSEHGRRDLAEKIVLHKGFPGWLHMIERGATTLWETWKESDDVYSNCHPMFGSVDEWILRFAGK